MKNKSWKTTLTGLIAGLPTVGYSLFDSYQKGEFNGQHGVTLAFGVFMIVIGALSKDRNVTGGTVPATDEAKTRIPTIVE